MNKPIVHKCRDAFCCGPVACGKWLIGHWQGHGHNKRWDRVTCKLCLRRRVK